MDAGVHIGSVMCTNTRGRWLRAEMSREKDENKGRTALIDEGSS